MRRILLFLALVAAAGCGPAAPTEHRMGAAGPPPGRVIPAAYDPSVSGLSGAVGEIVYVNGGTAAWVRTGINNTDWQQFPVPSSFSGAVAFNGVSTFNAEVSMPGVADFQPSGITFAVPVTFPTTTGQPQLSYSIDLDMMTVGAGGTVVPARAGKAFICQRYTNMVVSSTGTCTGAPTFDTGAVGPTFNEIFANATQLTAANINSGAGQLVSNNITGYHATSSADIKVAVHTAATGTTQLTVRQTYYGFWTSL